jgi:hypothetical protein
MKPIRLSAHARSYLAPRGFTEEEVQQAMREAPWEPAERGKTQCRQDFAYGALWNGKRYEWKQVRPIFVEEPDEIVVVTVYTYYF